MPEMPLTRGLSIFDQNVFIVAKQREKRAPIRVSFHCKLINKDIPLPFTSTYLCY